MNANQPPSLPTMPPKKTGMATWAIVLVAVGAVGVVGIAVISLLAAIAIPNFVKARTTAQRNACINNLRQIDGAKNSWALEAKKEATDTPTESEVTAYLKNRQLPICPARGAYALNSMSEAPTCSTPDHRLPAGSASPNR